MMNGRPNFRHLLIATLAAAALGRMTYAQDLSVLDSSSAHGAMPSPTTNGLATGPCGCEPDICCDACGPRWLVGIEYRYIRPHFSEAVAFATVTDSLSATGLDRQVRASELDFDYDSSFALQLGYLINDDGGLRLTYWHLDADTSVAGVAGPGQTIVDPFGNLAPAGSSIDTEASVQMNVFDLEYIRPSDWDGDRVGMMYTAGLRFADVDQFYESTIANAGNAVTSEGLFGVEFFGVGPYLSLTGECRAGARKQFSLFAKGAGALLVGQYDISTEITVPGATGGQVADRIRTVPVFESELGMAWYPIDRLKISTGWLFQAWLNLGVSGGTFDGERLPLAPVDTAFGGADDGDIMSFDGLFLRAELGF